MEALLKKIQLHLQLLLWCVLASALVVVASKTHFSPALLLSAFSPDAGLQESLSPEVREANALITKHAVKRYTLSDALAVHDQPLIESSYPARLEIHAPFVIAAREQKEFSHCLPLGHTPLITLYDCTDKTY